MKSSQQHDVRDPGRRLRLPHERDESPPSQAAGQRVRIRQAGVDVAAGQGDTDARATPGVECLRSPRQARRARPHLRQADPAAATGAVDATRKN